MLQPCYSDCWKTQFHLAIFNIKHSPSRMGRLGCAERMQVQDDLEGGRTKMRRKRQGYDVGAEWWADCGLKKKATSKRFIRISKMLGGAKTGHRGKTKIISKMFLWISKMFVAWTAKGVLRGCFFQGPRPKKRGFTCIFTVFSYLQVETTILQ